MQKKKFQFKYQLELRRAIHYQQQKLQLAIITNNGVLYDPEVIKNSEKLDRLIIKYFKFYNKKLFGKKSNLFTA